ncbi:hypothetical protein [Intrasporangium sp.]|uniref:hypothetical protein n=1 Tax=Intrasporangium sp. TaxID=1925024 RepID=UPI0032220A41
MSAIQLPSTVHSLLPATGSFGAGHLFALIIVVFLAIMAAFIVPLELRLRRERRRGPHRGSSRASHDELWRE